MSPKQASDRPQDEVLSKVDALLRRHRGGGPDTALDMTPEAEIPTLTELIESPSDAADAGVAREPGQPDALPLAVATSTSDEAWVAALRPELERIVAQGFAVRLPAAIQEQVMPEVMQRLGEGLNRLRDEMRTTVESVVRETIEREVKRALKALLKERQR